MAVNGCKRVVAVVGKVRGISVTSDAEAAPGACQGSDEMLV